MVRGVWWKLWRREGAAGGAIVCDSVNSTVLLALNGLGIK